MTSITALVLAWVESHPILAPWGVVITIGVIGAGAFLVYPLKKKIPDEKILDERPWKDPNGEQ